MHCYTQTAAIFWQHTILLLRLLLHNLMLLVCWLLVLLLHNLILALHLSHCKFYIFNIIDDWVLLLHKFTRLCFILSHSIFTRYCRCRRLLLHCHILHKQHIITINFSLPFKWRVLEATASAVRDDVIKFVKFLSSIATRRKQESTVLFFCSLFLSRPYQQRRRRWLTPDATSVYSTYAWYLRLTSNRRGQQKMSDNETPTKQ